MIRILFSYQCLDTCLKIIEQEKDGVSYAKLYNLLKCLNYTKGSKSSRNFISISNKGFKRKKSKL